MNEPWFRPYWILGRYPIHWKGAVFAAILLPVEIALARTELALSRDHPGWSLLAAAAFIGIAFAAIALVEWKTEKSYRRE